MLRPLYCIGINRMAYTTGNIVCESILKMNPISHTFEMLVKFMWKCIWIFERYKLKCMWKSCTSMCKINYRYACWKYLKCVVKSPGINTWMCEIVWKNVRKNDKLYKLKKMCMTPYPTSAQKSNYRTYKNSAILIIQHPLPNDWK